MVRHFNEHITHSHEECRNQVDTDLEASSLLAAFIMLKSNMQLAGERKIKQSYLHMNTVL